MFAPLPEGPFVLYGTVQDRGSTQLWVSVLDNAVEDTRDCGPCSIVHSLGCQCGISHCGDCRTPTESLMSIF